MRPTQWLKVFTTSGDNSSYDVDISEYNNLLFALGPENDEYVIEVQGLFGDRICLVTHTIEAIVVQSEESMTLAWEQAARLEAIRKEKMGDSKDWE